MIKNVGSVSESECGNQCDSTDNCNYYKGQDGDWCQLFSGKFSSGDEWQQFVSKVDSGQYGTFPGYSGIKPSLCPK